MPSQSGFPFPQTSHQWSTTSPIAPNASNLTAAAAYQLLKNIAASSPPMPAYSQSPKTTRSESPQHVTIPGLPGQPQLFEDVKTLTACIFEEFSDKKINMTPALMTFLIRSCFELSSQIKIDSFNRSPGLAKKTVSLVVKKAFQENLLPPSFTITSNNKFKL
eukprot:GHVL01002246.1.p2 GENE.GHVL01002246.1~~GHVL01002246.1.p2  ORF type:complete len:162 (-),score=33.92 GHVL01002246.1:101-586(-)